MVSERERAAVSRADTERGVESLRFDYGHPPRCFWARDSNIRQAVALMTILHF